MAKLSCTISIITHISNTNGHQSTKPVLVLFTIKSNLFHFNPYYNQVVFIIFLLIVTWGKFIALVRNGKNIWHFELYIYQQKHILNHDQNTNFLSEPRCKVDRYNTGRFVHVNGSCVVARNQRDVRCKSNTTVSVLCDESDSISLGSFICLGPNDWDVLIDCNFTSEQILYKCYIIFHG